MTAVLARRPAAAVPLGHRAAIADTASAMRAAQHQSSSIDAKGGPRVCCRLLQGCTASLDSRQQHRHFVLIDVDRHLSVI
jgi:hypothetical protein